MLAKDEFLGFAVVFRIPVFFGMTAETGAQDRRAGRGRHPGAIKKRKLST
jgi:hypothetical protein